MEPGDDELLRLAGAGHADAFEVFAARHDVALLRFAARVCASTETAEDAVQEGLLSAWRNAKSFRGEASPRTWLFGVVLHACRRQARLRVGAPQRHESIAAARSIASSVLAPDDAATRAELGRALDAALAELDPAARAILLLRDVEELPGGEVARMLELSLPAMKSRLHRARLELKQRLEARLGHSIQRAP